MITGLSAGPSFAETNSANSQANLALAELVQQVAAILAGKGYSVTMAKTAGGVGGQYLLTDRYDAYIGNIPTWAGYSYYLSVSDLGSSASKLANAILYSFDWKSAYGVKAVVPPPSSTLETEHTIIDDTEANVNNITDPNKKTAIATAGINWPILAGVAGLVLFMGKRS